MEQIKGPNIWQYILFLILTLIFFSIFFAMTSFREGFDSDGPYRSLIIGFILGATIFPLFFIYYYSLKRYLYLNEEKLFFKLFLIVLESFFAISLLIGGIIVIITLTGLYFHGEEGMALLLAPWLGYRISIFCLIILTIFLAIIRIKTKPVETKIKVLKGMLILFYLVLAIFFAFQLVKDSQKCGYTFMSFYGLSPDDFMSLKYDCQTVKALVTEDYDKYCKWDDRCWQNLVFMTKDEQFCGKTDDPEFYSYLREKGYGENDINTYKENALRDKEYCHNLVLNLINNCEEISSIKGVESIRRFKFKGVEYPVCD
ncbi:MAG: hypothetical protein PHP21_02305 [Patescibacteria group bacterium]|nr:hypothetical protein [Patescibacteria group bacterium]